MDAMEKAQMMEDCAANTLAARDYQQISLLEATLHARCMLGGSLAGESRIASWVTNIIFQVLDRGLNSIASVVRGM